MSENVYSTSTPDESTDAPTTDESTNEASADEATDETPADEATDDSSDDDEASDSSDDDEASTPDYEALYRADEVRIADLEARLAQAQAAQQTATTGGGDNVISTPGTADPATSADDGAAVFVPVPPAPGTVVADDGEVLTQAQPVPTAPTAPTAPDTSVHFDPAPRLSDSDDPSVPTDDVIDTEDELFEKVSEILVLVREIHETVAYVKAEAPKVQQALSNSPFAKMLPGILGSF